MGQEKKPVAKMTRKSFLKAAILPAAALPLARPWASNSLTSESPAVKPSSFDIGNAQFRLSVTAGEGIQTTLVHKPSSLHLADGAYSYSFGTPAFTETSSNHQKGATVLKIAGRTQSGLEVLQEFHIPDGEPWLEERIAVCNRGSHVQMIPNGRCGFVLPVTVTGNGLESALKDFRIIAVPFRREPQADRNQYADYTLHQVLTETRKSVLRSYPAVHWSGNVEAPIVYEAGFIETNFPCYASEGWVFTDGRQGFLITKYSQQGMEWAILDSISLGDERMGLRWGGWGIYQGDPEQGARLGPQESHKFGVTRITAFEGGMLEGFYAFRREMESHGHECPAGFNPPIHWNELYDNKLYWFGKEMDDPEYRKKYYTLADMKAEAAKAKAIGCEALYMDPGWDTSFASKIWDESRLGKQRDFVQMLQDNYGLSLSLHTPLSGWCDPRSYPREMDRMDRDGARANLSLCGASQQYVEETLSRFDALGRDGATYFMFDGDMYHGECWDANHGHRIPARREEHVAATNRLARLVHAKYPNILIEMHDPVLGGSRLRYVPLYYGHGANSDRGDPTGGHGYDSVWGFELMWDPMTDLVGRHSIALYYYNLAYSLPLYLHIDLRKDNENALMFWWNASTCRHLGIGGTHADPSVRKAQIAAMADYKRLKAFFTAGTFYGINEETHLHRHPDKSVAVINCFNLEDHVVSRRIEFVPTRFDLDETRNYTVRGASVKRDANLYLIETKVAAYGHSLVEVL